MNIEEDKNIIKIEQPQNGWTIKNLSVYGFNFYKNEKIAKHQEVVLSILNNNLSYFYYQILNNQKELIFPDETLKKINIESKTKYPAIFAKSILEYSNFINYKRWYNSILSISMWEQQQKEKENEKKEKEEREKDFKEKYPFLFDQTAEGYTGIYGIYSVLNENKYQLLYVGLTMREFKLRWIEHINIITGKEPVPPKMVHAYSVLQSSHEFTSLILKPIIIFEKLQSNRPLTDSEKEAMEFAIIQEKKPPANIAGLSGPYYFKHDPG